jgi:hypothetical protein
MTGPAEWIDLYRRTSYDVRLPGGKRASLRIGRHVPLAIKEWTAQSWPLAFISACNPQSEPVPAKRNRQRMRAMCERVRKLCRVLPGAGHIPDPHWREASLLVAGLPMARVDALAREFGQNAIVTVAQDQRAVLRIYRTDWRSEAGIDASDIEWSGQTGLELCRDRMAGEPDIDRHGEGCDY